MQVCISFVLIKSNGRSIILLYYIILQLIKQHRPADYDSVEKLLRFDTSRYDSVIEIELVKKDAEVNGWMITLESEQKVNERKHATP